MARSSERQPQGEKSVQDVITELTQRHQNLVKKQVEAQTKLQSSKQQLEKLMAEAREAFQTDDLDALKAKLKEMKAENERKRREYEEHLAAIEEKLKAVEKANADEQSAAQL